MRSLFFLQKILSAVCLIGCLLPALLLANSALTFEKEKNRFSFAQMHMGYEYNQYDLTIPSITAAMEEDSAAIHNIILGGWHFWGMSDIYIVFPFENYQKGTRSFSPGIETAFRWYPLPIANSKFRPFIGAGFNFQHYQQSNSAPQKTHLAYPINAGISIANHAFQLEAGIRYLSSPSFNYFVSSTEQKQFSPGETSFFFALKRVVDTTARNEKQNTAFQKQGFYPYFGVGFSSAWRIDGENSYFAQKTPWIDNDVSMNTFPELSIGMHWKNSNSFSHRTLFNLSWRNFSYQLSGYGSQYKLNYNGLAVEVAQTLLDYNGFVPFVGLSYNMAETRISGDISAAQENKIWGAIIGWDILPTGSHAAWCLRTILRWYPSVDLPTTGDLNVAFPNFEVNFLQWVYQF